MTIKGKAYLAVDIGASSGRVVAGFLNEGKLTLEEVHRFDNGVVHVQDHLHWDLLRQWSQVKDGLRKAHQQFGSQILSVGVDTWGVDFGLLGRNDELLGNPHSYRDSQTSGILDKAFKVASREEIFNETGLQFMEFNSLFQLYAMQQRKSSLLGAAESLLMMPDLFHWLLSGEKANEQTNASTTQFYNPQTCNWSESLLNRFDLPTSILQTIVKPGTVLGPIQDSVATEIGLQGVNVVLPGTHDTASAVMSVPVSGMSDGAPNWCYISSGTWSLMGVEMPKPIVNDRCRELNFTNEGGVGGTTRLLKNIPGLWLIQECRRIWNLQGQNLDWQQMIDRAAAAPPLVSLIDPDHAQFLAPNDMPKSIVEYCQSTRQSTPESEGSIVRTVLESLALRYRMVLGWLEELMDHQIDRIHIVGGGIQNQMLCQMTANACNLPVITGPVEATAIGNLMVQAIASGEVASIAEARDVIRNSFEVKTFEPENPDPWDEAYQRYENLLF